MSDLPPRAARANRWRRPSSMARPRRASASASARCRSARRFERAVRVERLARRAHVVHAERCARPRAPRRAPRRSTRRGARSGAASRSTSACRNDLRLAPTSTGTPTPRATSSPMRREELARCAARSSRSRAPGPSRARRAARRAHARARPPLPLARARRRRRRRRRRPGTSLKPRHLLLRAARVHEDERGAAAARRPARARASRRHETSFTAHAPASRHAAATSGARRVDRDAGTRGGRVAHDLEDARELLARRAPASRPAASTRRRRRPCRRPRRASSSTRAHAASGAKCTPAVAERVRRHVADAHQRRTPLALCDRASRSSAHASRSLGPIDVRVTRRSPGLATSSARRTAATRNRGCRCREHDASSPS